MQRNNHHIVFHQVYTFNVPHRPLPTVCKQCSLASLLLAFRVQTAGEGTIKYHRMENTWKPATFFFFLLYPAKPWVWPTVDPIRGSTTGCTYLSIRILLLHRGGGLVLQAEDVPPLGDLIILLCFAEIHVHFHSPAPELLKNVDTKTCSGA